MLLVMAAVLALSISFTRATAQEPEPIRALLVAMRDATKSSSTPLLLSSLVLRTGTHDSVTLAALKPHVFRIVDGDVSKIADTTVVILSKPKQTANGDWRIQISVAIGSKCPNGTISSPSVVTNYSVLCRPFCATTVMSRSKVSSSCRDP